MRAKERRTCYRGASDPPTPIACQSVGRAQTTDAQADPRRRPRVAHHRALPVEPPRHPASPEPADLKAVRRFLEERTRPTAIDLFCGAGGLSLGLERAGFDVIVGADSDPWAVRTHEANLPGLSWCGDLSDPDDFLGALRAWGIESVDLLAGGVPCQPFSRAGSSRIRDLIASGARAPHDSRADLWSSFIRAVEHLQPEAVLVENVPDLPRWDDGAVLIGLYESLRTLGYRVEARVLDGPAHGVPQHRQRLILLGFRGWRRPEWPEPAAVAVTLRDAIGDLPPIPRAQRAERLAYDPRRMGSDFQRRMRQDVTAVDADWITEHVCRDVRVDDLEAFRHLQQGDTYMDIPMRLRRYRSDVFTDKYKRLSWDAPCRSITAHIAKDGYWYIHPDQHRTLSIREAARVQTFPDDFRFAGTPTHRYRQIGNAVPVALGEAVGRAVMHTLRRPRRVQPIRSDRGIRDALIAWHTTDEPWTAPWRRTADPWQVLLGELALTRARPRDAERIHAALRDLAPTPAALLGLDSPVERLAAIGLTDRGTSLVALAEQLVVHFDGGVPDDEVDLALLPGVGDYVRRAVLTFAFGRRQVLVDRTTSRIASRVMGHGDRRRFQLRLDLHRLAGAEGPDTAFNTAILALGRSICLPARPLCGSCPLRADCRTGRTADRAAPLPVVVAQAAPVAA